jgi:hypothetical protein
MAVSTAKFNASDLFKFKASSLLLAFFLSFSLIGCGGGGGGSSDGGSKKISLSLIDSFPDFDDSGLSVAFIDSNKEYSVSSSEVNRFKAAIAAAPYYFDYDPAYDVYYKMINAALYAEAEAYDNTIDLYIDNDGTSDIDDSTFENTFGPINGKVVYVYVITTYSTSPANKIATYYNTLNQLNTGFECWVEDPSGAYVCGKLEDGLLYYWLGKPFDNTSAFYIFTEDY